MIFLAARLREPSTWAALAALAGVFGVPGAVTGGVGALLDVAPALIDVAAVVGASLAAIFLSERGSSSINAGDGDTSSRKGAP